MFTEQRSINFLWHPLMGDKEREDNIRKCEELLVIDAADRESEVVKSRWAEPEIAYFDSVHREDRDNLARKFGPEIYEMTLLRYTLHVTLTCDTYGLEY